jgi:putative ABC transport system substrate-binding protein
MNRRGTVLALLALGAAPVASLAQPLQGDVPRIGFLISETRPGQASRIEALRSGLRERGYVEGETLAIEIRTAGGKYERLPALAAELVDLNVDVIVTFGVKAAVAARRATTTIPLVIPATADPVASKLVTNLARPDGNITGSAVFGLELYAKRLERLKEVAPQIARIAAFVNPVNASTGASLQAMRVAGDALKVELQVVEVRTPGELESAFASLANGKADAILVQQDTLFGSNYGRIAGLAASRRMPSVGNKEFAEAGGLLGYGASDAELYRRGAYFVDRILKGAKPADLPFERPTKFELVFNLKTARALALEIPQSVLLGADRVID